MHTLLFAAATFVLIVFGIIVIAVWLLSPTSEQEDKVIDAVEKTFPDSTLLNILNYLENDGQDTVSMSWVYSILIDLEARQIIASFNKEGVYYKRGAEEENIPVKFFRVIGRKSKKSKQTHTDADHMPEAI